jgi:methyl-accepting chemotaxis protein
MWRSKFILCVKGEEMKFSIRTKIIFLFSVIFTLAILSIGIFAVNTMKTKVVESAQEKLKSDLAMTHALFDENMPGDWKVQDQNLYKGDKLLNDNFELVDNVGKMTGDTTTIFMADTRLVTNVKKTDGTRAVGTKISDNVAQAVIKEGRTYMGKADVVGTINQTIYEPIKDANGEIIGILYVGVPNTIYDQFAKEFSNSMLIFGVIGLIITIIMCDLIAVHISKPLKIMNTAANQIALGNLIVNWDIKNSDETGHLSVSLTKMSQSLGMMVQKVRDGANKVDITAKDMSLNTKKIAQTIINVTETANELFAGADKQSMNIQGAMDTIEQAAASIQEISATIQELSAFTQKISQRAKEGNGSMDKAINEMNNINTSTSEMSVLIDNLYQRSSSIGKIVDLISNIADQTNLLALNATIEAARAGEHGLGFAVVAEEVRKLSEQSRQATNQISELINHIQVDTNNAVKAVDGNVVLVKKGSEVISNGTETFLKITQYINDISRQTNELSLVTEQLAKGSEDIVQNINYIKEISTNVAKSSQNMASACEEESSSLEDLASDSEELTGLSQRLQETVAQFKL